MTKNLLHHNGEIEWSDSGTMWYIPYCENCGETDKTYTVCKSTGVGPIRHYAHCQNCYYDRIPYTLIRKPGILERLIIKAEIRWTDRINIRDD